MRRFVMDEPPGPQGDLDTVLLDLDPSVDPAAAEVLLGGVPRRLVGGGYSVLGRAERLTDDLVRFASNESSGYFCIEVQTLHVVEVPDVETTDRVPVNSSLGHFRDAVRMFNAAYPFYAADEDHTRWARVAERLEAELVESDVMAGTFQGYWEDVLSSVSIGDYSTEAITDGLPER